MHANGRQRQTAVHQDAAILDHFCTRVIHSSMHSFLTHARQTQQASLLEQPTVSNHFGSVLPSNARVLLRLKVLDAMRHFMSSSSAEIAVNITGGTAAPEGLAAF